MTSRIQSILEKMNSPIIPYKRPQFVPVWNPEDYFNDLENVNESDTTYLRELHNDFPSRIDEQKILKKASIIDIIPKVGKLNNIYEKYLKKNKKAPIQEYIKALHEAGYPEDMLMDFIKKDEKRKANMEEINNFVVSIFGEVNDKKVTVKKKTLNQILKFKKMIYAMPEIDDELPNDDCDQDED